MKSATVSFKKETLCFFLLWRGILHVTAIRKLNGANAIKMTTPMQKSNDPVSWVMEEYLERRHRNPSYSLRAFSRQLQVPTGHLSGILSKKRPLTKKMGIRIADRLGFGDSEKLSFLKVIEEREGFSSKARKVNLFSLGSNGYKRLKQDEFFLISDWYHFAILSLMETRDFKNSPKWIAKRLGILPSEAEIALKRLERLNLTKNIGKKIVPNQDGLATTTNIPCAALRKSHRQNLHQAIECLDNISVKDSDITSITMAIDVTQIQTAKVIIQNFRRYLAKVLETGRRTEVYNLNVQLVPVTKLKGN